jgi:hypothetical protein
MKQNVVLAGLFVVAAAGTLQAQANSCPAGGSPTTPSGASANVVRDACLQAVDVFQFMAPQLGLALAGGNATLGQGGTLGGLGHFSIGLRGNVFSGDLPQVNDFPAPRNQQNAPSQELPSKKQIIGLPVADAAIGIFKGIPLGLTNVGGVDVLVNATYVPKIGDDSSNVQIRPQSSVKFGYGVRVGLLQESLVVPGVSVTYIKRDLPTTDIIGTSSQVDLQIKDADVKTSAWRVVASKSLVLFGIAAGVGQDSYDQSTTIGGSVKNQVINIGGTTVNTGSQPIPPVSLSQKVKRTNMFLDLSLNLPLFKIVGEVGQVSGASPAIPQFNTFSSGAADDSRVYGSLGLRFGW